MPQVNLTEMGKVGLTGWRGKLGQRIAEPVAERTHLTQDQVKAILGAAFLALSTWQFVKMLRRVIVAGRGETQPA
jgi:hypothetical protein